MLGPGSSKARNHLSLIGGKEGILGQNCSANDNITTPTLPPPASKQIKQQNYKCLLLPSQPRSQGLSSLPQLWERGCCPVKCMEFFLWGLSFNTKRSISKELSFCTQKLLDGNHVKLGSRAYSQAWCSI